MSPRSFAPVSVARTRVTTLFGPRIGLVSITAAAVLWGTTGVAARFLHDAAGLSPVGIGFYRLAIAAAVLLVVVPGGAAAAVRAVRATPGQLVLSGVGLAAYQLLYFVAVALTGVSVATVVSLGLAPVLVAGAETARTRRAPDRRTGWSLLAGVTGLILCTASGLDRPGGPVLGRPVLGVLCAVGCAASYAATTVLSRHVSRRVGPLTTTTVSATVGAVALAPLAAMSGVAVAVRPGTVAVLAYLGVVTTALAYALFHSGLRGTSGSAAVVLTLWEPLTAALLARWVLAEPLPATTIAGGVLLLGAVTALYLAPTGGSAGGHGG